MMGKYAKHYIKWGESHPPELYETELKFDPPVFVCSNCGIRLDNLWDAAELCLWCSSAPDTIYGC